MSLKLDQHNWLSVLPTNTNFSPGDINNIQNGISFIPMDGAGGIHYIDVNEAADLFKAYRRCAPLASILSQMSKAFISGQIEVLNRRTGNYVRGEYKEWEKLMQRPNPLQSGKQFLKQLYTYTKINGYCFGIKMYAAGFNDRPYQLWLLPPENIVLERKIYGMVLPGSYSKPTDLYRIYFEYNGQRTELDPEALMYFSDSTIIEPDTLLPESRLVPLRYPISNIIAIYEASSTLIQKRGALGILSNHSKDQLGSIPIEQPERERVQNEFYRNYGLTRGQSQIIITTAALQWQQMSMNVRDLMLNETQLTNLKDIYEGFDYPFVISSHSDQATYTNSETGDMRLYQNTIIPDADDLIEQQLNENLKTETLNIKIVANFEAIPALQKTKKMEYEGKRALNEALKIEFDNGLITRNDWLEALGKDRIPNPEFDKYNFENTTTDAQ